MNITNIYFFKKLYLHRDLYSFCFWVLFDRVTKHYLYCSLSLIWGTAEKKKGAVE